MGFFAFGSATSLRNSLPLISDFVDDEPMGSHTIVHKKGSLATSFLGVPYGIRTHDIQNHNLTL